MPGHGDLTATAIALRAGTPQSWPEAWIALRARWGQGLMAEAVSRRN